MSQKGKTVKVVHVKEGKLVEEEMDKSRKEDKSEKNDEPIEQEETEDESDIPPVEFEDQMYELMQEIEMTTEYQEMTTEQENELVSQLTPREKAHRSRNERILSVVGKRNRTRNGVEVG